MDNYTYQIFLKKYFLNHFKNQELHFELIYLYYKIFEHIEKLKILEFNLILIKSKKFNIDYFI